MGEQGVVGARADGAHAQAAGRVPACIAVAHVQSVQLVQVVNGTFAGRLVAPAESGGVGDRGIGIGREAAMRSMRRQGGCAGMQPRSWRQRNGGGGGSDPCLSSIS